MTRIGVFALVACAACVAQTNTPQTILARAFHQIEEKDFQGASLTLRTFLKDSKGDPDLWNLLGVSESELNHDAAARDAFLTGLKLAPDSMPLHENLGFLYFREGNYPAAKTHLARAIRLGSANPGVAFSLAASQIRTGERQQGLALLLELEKPLRHQSDYWTERGWVELPENPARAEDSFGRALVITPHDVRALNGAASAAEAQDQDEKALSFLMRAKKVQPDDLRTLMHFGSVCLRRDLTVDAAEALERAHQLAPSNNLALFLDARAQIGIQQWQQSHDLFTEFDRKIPRYAPTLYALGWLDLKLNRPAEAREHLERSVSLDPGQTGARYELAQLDLDEGKLDLAEKQLRAVLDREPRHPKANVAFGDLLVRKGDLEEARARYEAAIEADPKSGPAHYKLSTVLMRLHQADRAEKERALGASLNAEALKAAKSVLVLAEPDGTLLSGEPNRMKEQQ